MSEKPLKKRLKTIKTKPVSNPTRSSKAEIDLRVTEVEALILQGFTRRNILQFASKWKVSDRAVDEYISRASEGIKEINRVTLQENAAIITSNYWDQYRTAKAQGNGTLCVTVLTQLAKLKGLEQFTVNHVIEDKRELSEMSDADLDALLQGSDGK